LTNASGCAAAGQRERRGRLRQAQRHGRHGQAAAAAASAKRHGARPAARTLRRAAGQLDMGRSAAVTGGFKPPCIGSCVTGEMRCPSNIGLHARCRYAIWAAQIAHEVIELPHQARASLCLVCVMCCPVQYGAQPSDQEWFAATAFASLTEDFIASFWLHTAARCISVPQLP